MRQYTIATLACVFALTACGGSNDNSEAIDGVLSDIQSFARLEGIEPDQTATDDLPASASYDGFMMTSDDSEQAGYHNDLSIDANFSAGTATGTASNFKEIALSGLPEEYEFSDIGRDNVKIVRHFDGSIELSNGEINDGEIIVDLVGTLDDDGQEIDVDVELGGQVYDVDAVADYLFVAGGGEVSTGEGSVSVYSIGVLQRQ